MRTIDAVGTMTDLECFEAFNVELPAGGRLWGRREVLAKKKMDKQPISNRVEQLRQAYSYLASAELSPFDEIL